jgi:hypothetical protein
VGPPSFSPGYLDLLFLQQRRPPPTYLVADVRSKRIAEYVKYAQRISNPRCNNNRNPSRIHNYNLPPVVGGLAVVLASFAFPFGMNPNCSISFMKFCSVEFATSYSSDSSSPCRINLLSQ